MRNNNFQSKSHHATSPSKPFPMDAALKIITPPIARSSGLSISSAERNK